MKRWYAHQGQVRPPASSNSNMSNCCRGVRMRSKTGLALTLICCAMVAGLIREMAREITFDVSPSPRDVEPNQDVSVVTSQQPPVLSQGRPARIEFGIAASLAREQSKAFLNQSYGYWPSEPCDPCKVNCLSQLAAEANRVPPIASWGPQALRDQIDHIFAAWKLRGGFTMDQQVSVNSCAYKTRTRWNPHGVWLHIFHRNVTTLRLMVDGYRRATQIKQYITEVVARSPEPFLTPLVVYVSVTDIPCNVLTPYLTFFSQRGVMGIVIPDDSFVKSVHGGSWEETRHRLMSLSEQSPFRSRQHKIFFRGSPTHPTRERLRQVLTVNHSEFADVKLAVIEKFKQFSVKIEDHVKYQYLLAIRGKTASSRDKYLNLLGSAIVWVSEEEPWFQFYHTLWRPYINYIPMSEGNALCVTRMLNRSDAIPLAAKIAERSLEVGKFLSQDVVDEYMRRVLRRYAELQTYSVAEDPIEFMRSFRSMVKRRYRSSLVMPDDQSPMKFFFEKWLSRRIKQMISCRTNNTHNGVVLPPDSKYRCWYM